MEQPDICPDGIYEIIRHCWQYDPDNRPRIREITQMLTTFVEDEVCAEVS